MQDLKAIKNIIKNTEAEFAKFASEAQTGFDYYNNNDKIKLTGAAAIDEINSYLKKKGSNPLRSADNRISLNRHMIVVDQKIGYLLSQPPVIDIAKEYKSETSETIVKSVYNVLGKQFDEVIKQLGIDAANTGRGWLAYWEDVNGKLDYYYINPLTVMPIYDNSNPKRELTALIRAYAYTDDKGDNVTRYEIWDSEEVAYLIKKTENGVSKIDFEQAFDGTLNIQQHSYGRVPFIEFRNNAKAFNDLRMYKDIIDGMDKLVSGFCNDVDDLQEIIWVIKNYTGETSKTDYDQDGNIIEKQIDLLQMLKAKKWISVDGDGGVDTVKGDIPYEARKELFALLDKLFWQAAMAVEPTPEHVGNQSGEYMEFLYGLLEQKASLTETMFRTAIDEFLQVVANHLGISNIEFTQSWYRTKPHNDKELVEIINSTPTTVMSEETKTKLHPLIEDGESERLLIGTEQQKMVENMVDSFEPPQEE